VLLRSNKKLSRFGSDRAARHEHQALNLLRKSAGKSRVNVHTVGARHHEITQNYVVALARAQQVECLFAVRQVRDVVLVVEDSVEQCADHGVVVDDQHATANSARWGGPSSPSSLRRRMSTE